LQQLLDGPLQLDRGDDRGPRRLAGRVEAQRLQGAGRHGVADDGGVAQHRARVDR
jgi:hypothetical protein